MNVAEFMPILDIEPCPKTSPVKISEDALFKVKTSGVLTSAMPISKAQTSRVLTSEEPTLAMLKPDYRAVGLSFG
jgi:hypothetical protein